MTTSPTVTNMSILSRLVILLFFVLAKGTLGQDCPRPPTLSNGRYKIKQRGHFVTFKCFRPYTLVGSSKAMCINRQWHFALPQPFCVTNGCNSISIRPVNADLEVSLNGALVKLTCHPGHVISGTDQVSERYSYF